MNLDSVIIMNLHISLWSAKKTGLTLEGPTIRLNNAAAAIRTTFHDYSIPWKENGDRLMTVWSFPDFYEEYKQRCLDLWETRDAFIYAYAEAKDRAEFELVEDYKKEDYPSVLEVDSKFSLVLNLDRVSRPLRPGDETENPVELFEEALEQRFREAQTALAEKIRKPLKVFIAGMSRPKNIYESSLSNLARAVEIGQKLNFGADSTFQDACLGIRERILTRSIADLRADPEVRAAAVAAATELLTQFLRGEL
jgi:hypothetical protein